MQRSFSPHLTLAQRHWKEHLNPGDLAIDATCGNGHDTLFLSELCSVVAMDLQTAALQNTEQLLAGAQKKAVLHRLCHGKIASLPLPYPPRLIVYNLGYLPGGDKSITTQTETTIESVKQAVEILAPGGAISITCYPGHTEGEKEEKALIDWASSLPSERWSVSHHRWINRPRSPSWIWVRDCQEIK